MDSTPVLGNWSNSLEVLLGQSFPIHRACRDGDVEQLGSLLAAEEVNLYEEDDFYGWTPIHWAAYFGKLQCLILMLENGACSDAPTERLNQTPTHIAAYGGYSHCLKWLLHSGAMVNKQLNCLKTLISTQSVGYGCDLVTSKFSQTPAHLCAYAGHPQCLYWLLKARANADLQDYMGETPIHKAARTGSMECVSLLVSQGAKLSIRNYSNNTASQVASRAGFTECANYLERAMQMQAEADQGQVPGCQLTSAMNTCPRDSPEGQADSHAHFISTNTYHSNPHLANNSLHQNTLPNVNNNNNNCTDDCDMDVGDGEAHQEAPAVMNGFGAHMANGALNGDVLLSEGVQKNVIPLAGKKRGREETEVECFKRARNDDSYDEKCKLNGWFLNNSHMTSNVNKQVTSESMVEHITTVTMQQGYDSLILDSMIDTDHGS